jgi:hypothetical protein
VLQQPVVDQPPSESVQVETKQTVVETPDGTSTATTTTATASEPVTVKSVAIGLWTKITIVVGSLAAAGINAGTIIQSKLEEISLYQLILIGIGVILLLFTMWYMKRRQEAADAKTHALIQAAADQGQNTVHLTK